MNFLWVRHFGVLVRMEPHAADEGAVSGILSAIFVGRKTSQSQSSSFRPAVVPEITVSICEHKRSTNIE